MMGDSTHWSLCSLHIGPRSIWERAGPWWGSQKTLGEQQLFMLKVMKLSKGRARAGPQASVYKELLNPSKKSYWSPTVLTLNMGWRGFAPANTELLLCVEAHVNWRFTQKHKLQHSEVWCTMASLHERCFSSLVGGGKWPWWCHMNQDLEGEHINRRWCGRERTVDPWKGPTRSPGRCKWGKGEGHRAQWVVHVFEAKRECGLWGEAAETHIAWIPVNCWVFS